MGSNCCGHETPEAPASNSRIHAKALRSALLINLGILTAEIWGAITANSEALLADSAHLISHILVILLSLAAIRSDSKWKSRAAIIKALLVMGLGIGTLIEATHSLLDPSHLPEPRMMTIVSALALAGNTAVLWVMARNRDDDINMRSAWICSQADLLTNVGLIVASVLVFSFQAGWPDGVLGAIIGLLVVRSAIQLLRQAAAALGSEAIHGQSL